MLGNALEYPAFCCMDEANTADTTLSLVKKANSVSVDLLNRLRKSFDSISKLKEPVFAKGAHTRTSLARESGWARVPMSQTRPCVECHEPDLADSGLARQGLRWGSARRRLAIGS